MKRALTKQEAWLVLNLIPGVGRSTVSRLLTHFKDPIDAVTASYPELEQVEGLTPKIAQAISEFDYRSLLEKELALIEQHGVKVISIRDNEYPDNLRQIFDPPFILYVKGELKDTDKYAIALVGSRRCSQYGKRVAGDLSAQLVQKGITVVSGMARGIDSAAHWGTIKAKGRTIAVLGCGLSVVYPPENRDLMEKIAQNGAVVSEFSMDTGPLAYNFPARNRVISGLSLGVVVVEASDKSGASITMGCALEQGREGFAVPGSIYSPTSRGTHRLLKQGAKLVENVDDILEELHPQFAGIIADVTNKQEVAAAGPYEITEDEQKILELLSCDPVHVDELVMNSEFLPQEVLGLLMSLELKYKVVQSPGQMYSLR
ncbi:MAG: DNA-protecting protein DprA [Candidatus Schekmanbacteria bacterium]|nr:DNA-protecting protein DprA [Candidatus Schekmanbacteria bacterium]